MKFSLNKIFVLVVLTLVIYSNQSHAQPTPPEGYVWMKVPALSDEFNTWDKSKWWKPLWNYGVPVQMRDKNSGVDDGKLWIKATHDRGADRWFETSRVMSKSQIRYPMYTECSMKTAHISAYNTFWMNNGDINNRDEIDICENNSKASITSQREERKYTMMSQYFVVKNGNTERNKGNFDNRELSEDNPLKGVAWNEDFHTLGVWWKDENNIQFYLNGEPAGKVKSVQNFTRNLNIIWDLWTIDANWSGGIADKDDLSNDSINTMYIDWIHTYALLSDGSTDILEKKNNDDVKIYPNPAQDYLTVELAYSIESDINLRIYDNMGRLKKTEFLQNQKNEIALNEMAKGLYYVKINTGNNTFTQKLLLK